MIRQVLILLVVLCLATSFTLEPSPQTPHPVLNAKLPEFTGLGYNLLQGNPYTNHIDQGFTSPIFKLTYQKGQTTEDSKYLIPDHTHSTQTISCSIYSKVASYTGTENYQKELSKITKFDTRLEYGFLKAAFSFSRTFQQFSNSTQAHNQTSYQSNAECTVYTIEMPLYSNEIQLSQDFIEGVKTSMRQNSWQQFLTHFGTHYTSAVTFGGRFFLEHTYSEQSMSLFTSMKLDIEMAANIQYYNKIGMSLTDEMKRYQNQTNLINSKVEVSRMATLGGLPPQSGNWIDWANTVKDNLAPVSYRLTTISVLFNFVQGIDSAAAIKSYEGYLNSYCVRNKCKQLTPERPPPKPLEISFTKSEQISGPSKSEHAYDSNDGAIRVAMRVYKVLMGSIGSIDSVQFFLTDGLVQHALPVIGNCPFKHTYQVPKSDEINCIRFGITYAGKYWKYSSMQFVTKNGVNSEVFKGTYNVNEYRIICLKSPEEHFVGFYGRYGGTFDSIGFNIMKETVQK